MNQQNQINYYLKEAESAYNESVRQIEISKKCIEKAKNLIENGGE